MLRYLVVVLTAGMIAWPAAADYSTGAKFYSAGDFKAAFREFLASANDGNSRAQFGLGVIYHKGKGVKQDHDKAIEWYKKAAEQGHATAQNNLGIMYRRGDGVARNPREAFTWVWMAAMQGNPRAEMNLADMFLKGEGVGKDLVQAYAWLEFAVTDLPRSGRQLAKTRRNEIVTQLADDEVRRAERMAKAFRESRE
jgi:uncharacterized protein